MFYKVKILNKHGKLLNTLTSEALSKRHWGLFEEQLKPSPGKKINLTNLKKLEIKKITTALISITTDWRDTKTFNTAKLLKF